MKSVACLGTVVAFVFGFCCSFCESTESTLTQGPKDTSVLTGETVTLECFTTNKNYPPAWSYQKVGSGEKKHISFIYPQDGRILIKLVNGYVERHRIAENRRTGEYSLQITDAKPEDAGSYSCQARGGLQGAEIRSAELSVFELLPVCASNMTDAVGENDCEKEPDVIEFSCKFRIYSNHLPKIRWINANDPEEVIKNDTATMDATGMASSKLIIKGNYPGLDKTHFKCIVASTENADDKQFTCDTPKINVLKISNLTKSKSLVAPDEVECTEWSKLNASGCEWYRGDDRKQEALVTTKPMLNLHRADLTAGTYSCFTECNIRGEPCPVKLLKVSYQPSHTDRSESEQSNIITVVLPVLIVVLGLLGAIGLLIGVFFIWKRYRYKYGGEADSPETQAARGSLLSRVQNHCCFDVPDAKSGGLTKSERTRLAEEKAEATMRANAARQKSETNQVSSPDTDVAEGVAESERTRLTEENGPARMRVKAAKPQKSETNQVSSPDTDVAEGVAADKTKHE